MKRIISIGHSAFDRVYRIAAFPERPTKVRALEHIEGGGGMAANAAVAAARLGAEVELWSRVGDDAVGGEILTSLVHEGVDTTYVRTVPGARTSTSAIIVDARGERLIVGERDHAMSLDASWLPLERIGGAGVVMSDLRWFEATMAAFLEARAQGVPTLLDSDLGGAGHASDFLPLTDYAIFSQPALEAFMPGAGERAQLEKVLSLGPRHAGVTRGEFGYVWLEPDRPLAYQPAISAPVVDTTGAGDAFHGGFAAGLAAGLPAAECARLGAAVAALKCRKLGARAGLPDFEEVRGFLKSHT